MVKSNCYDIQLDKSLSIEKVVSMFQCINQNI